MDWGSILDAASRIITALILIAGAFAAVFNATLTEWIRNKFARAVSRELESHKHQLSRDLEAYKATIVRELEEFKLGIDIRRSIALKMAEFRLTALTKLAFCLDEYMNEALSSSCMTAEVRVHNMDSLHRAFGESRGAARSAEIFLPIEVNAEIVGITRRAHAIVSKAIEVGNAVLNDDLAIVGVQRDYARVALRLRAEVYAVPRMDPHTPP